MQLASRFTHTAHALQSDVPLTDEQIRLVAPSIFSAEKHASRSDRYAYIPTAAVLSELRREGFQPFMVCQTRVRHEHRRDHTKHMIRLRHASDIAGEEANEIILINSHDGTSAYQMLAGMFRFVCKNGLVCGTASADIRVPHKGDILTDVVHGAYDVLEGFRPIAEAKAGMKALTLAGAEQEAFARAALALRYDDVQACAGTAAMAPVTPVQLLAPRRADDAAGDLWTTLNRVQENMVRGGLAGRSRSGRRMHTRPVSGIDSSIRLNRALWTLAEEMRRLKG